MKNTVSIITAGVLIISLSSFQSALTKNNIPTELYRLSYVLDEAEPNNEGVFNLPDFLANDEIRSYAERFEINQNTSKEELEKIKAAAESDGIEFGYTSKFNGDRLSKLSLNLNLDNKDEGRKQSLKTDLDVDGEFSYTLAWENDSKGMAVHIYYGKTEGFDEDDSAHNFDRSIERMDSLALNMKEEMNLEREKMKEEMDQMRKDMKDDFKEFDKEESGKDKDGFSESSSEEAKAMQAEMKEEMRKMKKEFKKEKKEMEAEMKAAMKEMKRKQNQDKKESKDDKGGARV
jgi:hypothetical protein